ncbi:kinesin-like protein [Pseudoscourfieldia marina]
MPPKKSPTSSRSSPGTTAKTTTTGAATKKTATPPAVEKKMLKEMSTSAKYAATNDKSFVQDNLHQTLDPAKKMERVGTSVGAKSKASDEAIRVFVRVRPHRKELGETIGRWTYDKTQIDDLEDNREEYQFHRVYMQDTETKDIYENEIKHLLDECMSGFNGTVFAYGQTGAGKTHTILGNESMPGLMPLAINEFFEKMNAETERAFFVSVSYIEIYKEELRDLLVKEHKPLKLMDGKKGPYVPGSREPYVQTASQAMELVMVGQKARQVGSTKMNIVSSRSHTIFRIHVESRMAPSPEMAGVRSCAELPQYKQGKGTGSVRFSTLAFVDLAGSERLAKTEATGERAKEGVMINKSLLTLGLVINILSGGDGAAKGAKKQHVPYRDSNLTRLLQPALGGNSKCVNVCCVHIADQHTEETHSTLRFAVRAKQIINHATLNETETPEAAVERLKLEAEELKKKLSEGSSDEINELKQELQKQRAQMVKARFTMAASLIAGGSMTSSTGIGAAAAPRAGGDSKQVAELQSEISKLEDELAEIKAEKQVMDKEKAALLKKFEDLAESYEEQRHEDMKVADQMLSEEGTRNELMQELKDELKRYEGYHEQDKETISRLSEAADMAEKEIERLRGLADIDETKGEDGSWLNWQRWREAERSRISAVKQRDDAEHAARIFKDKMMEEVDKNISLQRTLEKLQEKYGEKARPKTGGPSSGGGGFFACFGS